MKTRLLFLFPICFLLGALKPSAGFLQDQLAFSRVREAYRQKAVLIKQILADKGLDPGNFHLLLLACKEESLLELYAKKKGEKHYQLLKQYPICARSGSLGPKKRSGDGQVPEGFYSLNRFNPASNYHLSLGINYPNAADKKNSAYANLGGDIFIHGYCVTIGCMPMTNPLMEEIYLFACLAKNNGQKDIPVYIFPYRMNAQNREKYFTAYASNKELLKFWSQLEKGYQRFNKTHQELRYGISASGEYVFR